MRNPTLVFFTLLLFFFFIETPGWAEEAAKPRIGLEMSAYNSSQTNIVVKVVYDPAANYSFSYNYSVDGGASWVLTTDGSLLSDGSWWGYSNTFVAENYQNYLIRVTAKAAGYTDKTAYTMAYPPNPNGHGNYSANTNLCKNCHSTHKALGAKLLAQISIENLCTTCHGSTANGAKYLAIAGKQVVNASYNLADSLGGGFPSGITDSRHYYKDSDPSAYPPGGKPGSSVKMSCVKCHQGHFLSDNATYIYRLLKPTMNENENFYDTAVAGIYPVANPGEGDAYATLDAETAWIPRASGLSSFCGSCHNDYNVMGTGEGGPANTIAVTNQDGKSIFDASYYRHPVDIDLTALTAKGINPESLPIPLFSKRITCLTCHKAHGATTTQEGEPTAILRLDNRSTCENCHQK